LPSCEARLAPLPTELDPGLLIALRNRGIEHLYAHQREAWDRTQAGEDIVIATPTASGKSLCYHLPVIHAVRSSGARALYLFPTKALAQDQMAGLLAINEAGRLGLRASTFDGDTPADARRAVREHGDIVITNPDMLHQAILPQHVKWAGLFERISHVVIDELHAYRGLFGAHMANVLRRLDRILRFHGASPRYITCSATIGNPGELASRLLDRPVQAITASGAPIGPRHLLIWNPPMVNRDLGIRASARSQSSLLARRAIEHGLKTIVFTNSRLEVEVITRYLKDRFDRDPRKSARVLAYRGGYLPSERHALEADLRGGSPDAVVSTSALELGIDIGALDVCILNGYPGTIASALQRLGRAGRRGRTAVGILVATSDLLDQYLARHPERFLEGRAEQASLDPDQLLIRMEHLRCAAFELPFCDGELFGGQDPAEALAWLAGESVLHHAGGQWHWIADSYPAQSVSLRAIADGNFTVIDTTGGASTVIAEVDHSAAALTLYEGAIHMIQSSPWQVERLDWVGRKAFVQRTRADYYTDAIDHTRLNVLDCFEQDPAGAGCCQHGEVHLVRHVAGYKKIRYYTHENVGYGPVNLPDQEMHTTALWWDIDGRHLDEAIGQRTDAMAGIHGAAWALRHIAALLTLSSAHDLGCVVEDGNGTWSRHGHAAASPMTSAIAAREGIMSFRPGIYLYDMAPGGSGLASSLYERRFELLERALQVITECNCEAGCPACVGPVTESSLPDRTLSGGHASHAPSPLPALSTRMAAWHVLELLGARLPATGAPETGA
jgi:DEAD/DEAH box helicase domain-containing protein